MSLADIKQRPNHEWMRNYLGDVTLKITKGTTPTTVGGRFVDHGINFLKVESITEFGALDIGKVAFIDEKSDELLRRSRLEESDVLFSIAGAIGRTYFVRPEDLPANVNQALAIVRFDPAKVCPKYGYYAMRASAFQGEALGRVVQCAQANVNLTQLSKSSIHVPPLDVQRRIVNILSTYDDLIENNRRRIQLLEEAARLLYKEWFVQLRFPGHEHVKIVDGVPEGWSNKPLTEVSVVNEKTLKNGYEGEIEYVDIASVSPNAINETTWYEFKDAPGRARRGLRHKDIIWSCVRPNRRSHALVWMPHDRLIASTGFAVISAKKISPCYLYQYLTTNSYVGYLTNNAGGAAYPAVTAKVFENSEVLVPTESLQIEYEGFSENIYQEIHLLSEQNKKLAKARDILLPRLMNGELAA